MCGAVLLEGEVHQVEDLFCTEVAQLGLDGVCNENSLFIAKFAVKHSVFCT